MPCGSVGVVATGEEAKRHDRRHVPRPTADLAKRRKSLAPEVESAFHEFSKAVFREGALSRKHKQIMAVAVAHVTQCLYCIRGHTKAATREGATPKELMEAIWVAAEKRAGGAYAHSLIALDSLDEKQGHAPHE
ncbi:MAG: carboxymuconolactone decarboxylase family protein [bacterium]|nr:carboxymuconolactone decarboxylase family protein [bacterium]